MFMARLQSFSCTLWWCSV